jgi:hypothetical protein
MLSLLVGRGTHSKGEGGTFCMASKSVSSVSDSSSISPSAKKKHNDNQDKADLIPYDEYLFAQG